jgi:HAD superfamily hydrolase (TIGR01509 family)
MAGKRAVIFDFDGVLADSWSLHEAAWREVLAQYPAGNFDQALARTIGWTSLESAELLAEECGLKIAPAELAAAKDELFLAQAAEHLKPLVGVSGALDRLRGAFTLAVSSTLGHEVVNAFLAKFSLASSFATVITSDRLAVEQEFDDLLGAIADELELEPSRIVLIDDSRNGILAAKRVSMNAIAFDSNPKHEIDFSMADAQIQSLDELIPELINQVVAS